MLEMSREFANLLVYVTQLVQQMVINNEHVINDLVYDDKEHVSKLDAEPLSERTEIVPEKALHNIEDSMNNMGQKLDDLISQLGTKSQAAETCFS